MNLMDKHWVLLLLVGLTQGCKKQENTSECKSPPFVSPGMTDLPEMLNLPIQVYMAPSWLDMFPELEGLYEAKQVLSITRTLFQHCSLRTKFFLSYSDRDFISLDTEIEVTGSGIEAMGAYITRPENPTAIVYLSAAKTELLGLAYLSTICNKDKKLARAMVQWAGSRESTAQKLAHDIGHTLGFYHDFDKHPSVRMLGKRTRTCGPGKLNGGQNNQLMNDGKPMMNSWSECTNEDFQYFYQFVKEDYEHFCLKEIKCHCGLAKRQEMMLGGKETEVNEYPWQVGIVYKTESNVLCGGSLISNMWVLSAAHCVKDKTAPMIQALLGEHDVTSISESNMVRKDISNIVNHPKYDKSTKNNDLTLLKLKTKIDFDLYRNIRPICLPENDDNDYAGYSAIVTGWGKTLDIGQKPGYESDNLQEATLIVLSNHQCNNNFMYEPSRITDQMLCVHVEGGGTGVCNGDSGGPVITSGAGNGQEAGQNYELIGVVSWSTGGCAKVDYPPVNTRVTKKLGWIKEITTSGWSTCPGI